MTMTHAFISTLAAGSLIRASRIIRPWNRRGSARAIIAPGAGKDCRPKRNGKRRRGDRRQNISMGQLAPDGTRAQFGARFNDTAPVTSFTAGGSPYGLLDMAGNAWEWVSSAYRPYPYDASDGREDLKAGPVRGTRGGGHDSTAEELTTTHRGRNLSRNPAAGSSQHRLSLREVRDRKLFAGDVH